MGAWGSLDHLVGAGEKRRRNAQPESLRGLEIDGEFVFVWGLHGQVSRFLALQYATDVVCRASVLV